nr:reverse transcriptase domain-containing protein [Tanacetum cinerariifolium]
MLLKEAEAAKAIRLRAEASNFNVVEKSFRDEVNASNERNTILKKERNALDVEVMDLEAAVLYTNFVEITLHLEERFYPHLLTTIVGRKWLLTYEMKLAIVKCMNLPDCLSALELKSNKDASVEALMNILRLEEHLAKRLGLNESQPHADQLMVPIYHSSNKTVVGASALSLALDVSDARVQRIRENIESHRSFLHGVFVPLAEPFSTAALTSIEGTSDTAPDNTTALSKTYVSASSIPPISTDDYEVVRLDGQEGAASCIAASSVLSSKRSRLISKASLFCTRSISVVLSVGMPISARMTTYVLLDKFRGRKVTIPIDWNYWKAWSQEVVGSSTHYGTPPKCAGGILRGQAIHEEVEKLMEARIMKEVHYHDWFSNLVMVKKHDENWRMCVDFKDLNKACLKDDDLVIKSRTKDEIARDIEETFKTLREINMKLNPKKCTFRIEEGIFLGYKVSTRGLKVCQEKVDVVLSLSSPKCLKDMQKLNGKLASLNSFLAKSAEKSLPFFKTLKKYTKKSDFRWTTEAEDAPEEDSLNILMTEEEELPEPWILFADESSCTDGSGAGLILTNPERAKFTYALRFGFDATNNEAEYEALIVGLKIAEQMGVKNL